MKTKYKDNYYNDQDEINFDKLNNFRKFNSDIKNTTQSKNHNIRYANSDKNYFNNIIKTEKNFPLFKKIDTEKEVKYYNSSDFQKFDQFNNFLDFENKTEHKIEKNIDTEFSYSSNDYGEFNKIIPIKNSGKKMTSNRNPKVKFIDYSKLKDNEKKLKNKLQIEKIKIVYKLIKHNYYFSGMGFDLRKSDWMFRKKYNLNKLMVIESEHIAQKLKFRKFLEPKLGGVLLLNLELI